MKSEEKALAACIKLAAAKKAVDQLTARIKADFKNCPANSAPDEGTEPHLFAYYRGLPPDDGRMPDYVVVSDGAPFPDCHWCRDADEAIQQRKSAKRQLGIARMVVTKIGNARLKGGE